MPKKLFKSILPCVQTDHTQLNIPILKLCNMRYDLCKDIDARILNPNETFKNMISELHNIITTYVVLFCIRL